MNTNSSSFFFNLLGINVVIFLNQCMQMIQKLSKKHINLETKLMVVIEIAEKEGIDLDLEGLHF